MPCQLKSVSVKLDSMGLNANFLFGGFIASYESWCVNEQLCFVSTVVRKLPQIKNFVYPWCVSCNNLAIVGKSTLPMPRCVSSRIGMKIYKVWTRQSCQPLISASIFAGNLVAYACKVSFQNGFDGYLSFTAKTKLIDHYIKTLEAYHFGGHLMIINTIAANKLIDKYFKSI